MAFIGVPTVVFTSRNIHEVGPGLGLSANLGAFDPTGVALDSGLLTTDLTTTPAGAVTIPTTFGPGEGNWTAADVAAVDARVWDYTAVADGRFCIAQKALVGGNLQVGVHSLESGLGVRLTVRLNAEHTVSR